MTLCNPSCIQADPWEDTVVRGCVEGNAVLFSLEGGAAHKDHIVTVNEEWWNRGWVETCFGQEGLRQLGDKAISCSGAAASLQTQTERKGSLPWRYHSPGPVVRHLLLYMHGC
jgi:hypothetical protein